MNNSSSFHCFKIERYTGCRFFLVEKIRKEGLFNGNVICVCVYSWNVRSCPRFSRSTSYYYVKLSLSFSLSIATRETNYNEREISVHGTRCLATTTAIYRRVIDSLLPSTPYSNTCRCSQIPWAVHTSTPANFDNILDDKLEI